jgi:hypothetical protein
VANTWEVVVVIVGDRGECGVGGGESVEKGGCDDGFAGGFGAVDDDIAAGGSSGGNECCDGADLGLAAGKPGKEGSEKDLVRKLKERAHCWCVVLL